MIHPINRVEEGFPVELGYLKAHEILDQGSNIMIFFHVARLASWGEGKPRLCHFNVIRERVAVMRFKL